MSSTRVIYNGVSYDLAELRSKLKLKHAQRSSPGAAPSTVDSDQAIRLSFERQEYDVVLGSVPDEPMKPSTLCIFGDGTYLLRKNAIGSFFRKIDERKTPSLPSGPAAFFKRSLPKVPLHILRAQTSFYRAVMKDFSDSEAYTLILWDLEKKEYILYCPVQKVSGASVDYTFDIEEYPSSRYIQVVSCHSHNSMDAFFSGTDDGDEKADMLYFVMGKLDSSIPTYKGRANLKGKQACFLQLSDIFDLTEQEYQAASPYWTSDAAVVGEPVFPADWLTRVTAGASGFSGVGAYGQGQMNWFANYHAGTVKHTTFRTRSPHFNHFSPHPFPKSTALVDGLKDLVTALKAAEPKVVWTGGRRMEQGVFDSVAESDAFQDFVLHGLQQGFLEEVLGAVELFLDEDSSIEAVESDSPDSLDYLYGDLSDGRSDEDCSNGVYIEMASDLPTPFDKDWS